MERITDIICIGLIAGLGAIHPPAAIGAAVGCFFFLASPAATNRGQRLFLGLFSFGIGYASGVFAYGGGPPHSDKAMLVAASVSALAAVVWTGFYRMAAGDGPLPQWVKELLNFIPWTRNQKGPNDGS